MGQQAWKIFRPERQQTPNLRLCVMSDVLDAQTLIPAARNPVIVIVTPSLAKGVNLKVRWTLDDDAGERKSQFISSGFPFS
jgi:hypothetical protein